MNSFFNKARRAVLKARGSFECWYSLMRNMTFVGLARLVYKRYCGREITKYTVIYGVYTRFCSTLDICTVSYMVVQM